MRITKATHALFLESLDAALLSMGAEKTKEAHAYRIETIHGTLELRPAVPIHLSPKERLDYDLTVFGRFLDAERAAKSLGRWKWNHHFGYRGPEDVEFCITHLCMRLSVMLPQTEPEVA